MTDPRPILWTPSEARAQATTMAGFIRHLGETRDLHFDDYPALWQWSVTELEEFWSAIREFFDLQFSTPPRHSGTPALSRCKVEHCGATAAPVRENP